MVNNAKPDSIITNMICRYLATPPPVMETPKVRSTELLVTALISKNTLRILNTIKPVTRVFTAKDRIKLVKITTGCQILNCDNSNGVMLSDGCKKLDILGADIGASPWLCWICRLVAFQIGVSGYCQVAFEDKYFQPPIVVAPVDVNQVARRDKIEIR